MANRPKAAPPPGKSAKTDDESLKLDLPQLEASSLDAVGIDVLAPTPRPPLDPDDEPTKSDIVVPPPAERKTSPPLTIVHPSGSPNTPPPVAAPRAAKPQVRMPELGPIDAYMKDPEVTEIMINDLRNVMIEKAGRILPTGLACSSLDDLNKIVRNILEITGRTLNADQPYIDAILPDGSRVNIVAAPLTLHGPCITIRKFPSKSLGAEDLIQFNMMDRRVAHFLSLCVNTKLNILISGGTSSGKTTLLNALIGFIPRNERLLTIEDTPELSIPHFNSVRLQTKPQTPTSPPISTREVLANALRMRPDRIIVGECRRAEAFDMLQAMNTGHEGSMTSLHANSPRDALSRLETLCMTAGIDLPLFALRKQIQSAVDLILQCRRFRNGKRRIVAVTEVIGMEGETITLQDIFIFDAETATFKFTGYVPTFVDRFKESGIDLPKNYFT